MSRDQILTRHAITTRAHLRKRAARREEDSSEQPLERPHAVLLGASSPFRLSVNRTQATRSSCDMASLAPPPFERGRARTRCTATNRPLRYVRCTIVKRRDPSATHTAVSNGRPRSRRRRWRLRCEEATRSVCDTHCQIRPNLGDEAARARVERGRRRRVARGLLPRTQFLSVPRRFHDSYAAVARTRPFAVRSPPTVPLSSTAVPRRLRGGCARARALPCTLCCWPKSAFDLAVLLLASSSSSIGRPAKSAISSTIRWRCHHETA